MHAELAQAADDFIDADIRDAQLLAGADLTGIRWSTATAWPQDWAGLVRAASITVGPDIFEITEQGGPRKPIRIPLYT